MYIDAHSMLHRGALLTCAVLTIATELVELVRAIDKNTQDYYELLGIRRGAHITDSELKKAYRRRAKEFHPDVNKSQGAEEIFLKISKGTLLLLALGLLPLHGAPFCFCTSSLVCLYYFRLSVTFLSRRGEWGQA